MYIFNGMGEKGISIEHSTRRLTESRPNNAQSKHKHVGPEIHATRKDQSFLVLLRSLAPVYHQAIHCPLFITYYA
jgi:hypothetical protein